MYTTHLSTPRVINTALSAYTRLIYSIDQSLRTLHTKGTGEVIRTVLAKRLECSEMEIFKTFFTFERPCLTLDTLL